MERLFGAGKRMQGMKKAGALFLAVSALVLFTGCGSSAVSSKEAAEEAAPGGVNTFSAATAGNGSVEEAKAEDTSGQSGQSANQAYIENRKLIKTVNMDVETRDFDGILVQLEEKIRAMEGYMESLNTYNGSSYAKSRDNRYADMTIRIPSRKLDEFLSSVEGICNVVRRSDNVEDVTLAYVDLESRKNALKTEQERLLELLSGAESMEDIIAIEARLSEVRYELESMESQLRTYDNLVDYSTVYLWVNEVEALTPAKEESIWERIGNGFVKSLKDIGNGLTELFVWVLVYLPYLVIAAMLLLIVWLAVRAGRRKGAKTEKAAKAGKTAVPGKTTAAPEVSGTKNGEAEENHKKQL